MHGHETERRGRGKGRSPAQQGDQRPARSQDLETMTRTKGRHNRLNHPGAPHFVSFFKDFGRSSFGWRNEYGLVPEGNY